MTDLQVIGAGLGRTGTMSLKKALEDLGFGPCHHMVEVLHHNVQKDLHHLWKDIADENNEDDALKKIFDGYKATVDYPGCMFFEKLMSWNPDAKVILSVRDSPEAWATSCRSTIFPAEKKPKYWYQKLVKSFLDYVFQPHRPHLHEPLLSIHKCIEKLHGVNARHPDTNLFKLYSDWKMHVIETVPADKLLIFNAKEGWRPLCKFLEVQVPEHEFPRTNTKEQFQSRRRKTGLIIPIIRAVVLASVVGGLGVLLKFYC